MINWHSYCQHVSVYCNEKITAHMVLSVHNHNSLPRWNSSATPTACYRCPERNFPAGQGQTTRCTFNDGLPAKSEHYSDSMAIKMVRFKSNRTPMRWIGSARAPTPTTNLTLKNEKYQKENWHSDCQHVSVYCTEKITAHMVLSVHNYNVKFSTCYDHHWLARKFVHVSTLTQ
jgi:hypothetical protein